MLGYDPDGTRTHNLFLRREAPYPLGHRARHAHFVMEKQYISSTQHNRRSLYVYNGNAVITVGSIGRPEHYNKCSQHDGHFITI